MGIAKYYNMHLSVEQISHLLTLAQDGKKLVLMHSLDAQP